MPKNTLPEEAICTRTYCALFDPEDPGECEDCIDGRWLEAVNQYASTCDGCGEQVHHDLQDMDEETQFGYCRKCRTEITVKGDYFTATADYLREHNNLGPTCRRCHKPMLPADDHGRFVCFCKFKTSST
jgi:hypothetical protein